MLVACADNAGTAGLHEVVVKEDSLRAGADEIADVLGDGLAPGNVGGADRRLGALRGDKRLVVREAAQEIA